MTRAPETFFTVRRVQEMLGLSRHVLTGLTDAGFVVPTRGARNALLFTFQDLMLLKTAHRLQQAGITSRRILSSLRQLKSNLPDEVPVTGLRVTAIGPKVAVRDLEGALADVSGQLLIDFEVAATGGMVTILDRASQLPEARQINDALHSFRQGEALEAHDPHGSEAAYRQAIALADDLAEAYINLGALLCESGRCHEAVALFERAVKRCPPTALVHFNLGIALEDSNRLREAVASYERSLLINPALADAHYNIGRLKDRLSDARGALRHYNAYRRLQKS